MLLLRHEQTVTIAPEFLSLGTQVYADTYEQMRSLVQGESFKDQIWLLEHPPVYTLGTAADPSHVLNPGDIPVIQTDRGGNITFHGPGQLVCYPILDLNHYKRSITWYMRELEQLIIDVLGEPYIQSKSQELTDQVGTGLGTFLGKTLLERKSANLYFLKDSKLGGACVNIVWKQKDLKANA